MSKFYGIGTDIIEIERILDSIEEFEDKFLDRLFTVKEQEYCDTFDRPALRYAGRFAAKEAIAKAFGVGFGADFTWLDVEIINNDKGKPIVHFSEKSTSKFKDFTIDLSISHCTLYATAVAIAHTKD